MIQGNDVLVKCKIPSFVADFVSVVGWIDDRLKPLGSNNLRDYSTSKVTLRFMRNIIRTWSHLDEWILNSSIHISKSLTYLIENFYSQNA